MQASDCVCPKCEEILQPYQACMSDSSLTLISKTPIEFNPTMKYVCCGQCGEFWQIEIIGDIHKYILILMEQFPFFKFRKSKWFEAYLSYDEFEKSLFMKKQRDKLNQFRMFKLLNESK